MPLTFADAGSASIPLFAVPADGLAAFLGSQPDDLATWAASQGFKAEIGGTLTVPGPDGRVRMALAGYGTGATRARGRFPLAAAAGTLPAGTYHLANALPDGDLATECLGWLLSGYRFRRYRTGDGPDRARLIAPDGIDAARVEAIAAGEALTRDLINTPASDLGPEELESAARDLAMTHDAGIEIIRGEALALGYPMIHAVGRASDRAPRLIDMRWGNNGPSLTLVGKGVCFDTGGLNLKPGSSMGLMKKDMGGAATVLGLAQMILRLNLKIRLRVLIPAVENSVSGCAYRPGDILASRKGLTVEVNNTDAEGRLVLADALALADEERPDLIVSMATLTGAARVAVGPDLSPFYVNDGAIAARLAAAAARVSDPVWRMPFHDPYEPMLEPGIADLDNAPSGGFAGSVTAALFLRRFVTNTPNYLHFDIYGWQPKPAPARPKGGVGMGARALLDALPGILEQ
ncbi:MAG: leucyl aminopeptidase family protein [Marinibacterium sp.]